MSNTNFHNPNSNNILPESNLEQPSNETLAVSPHSKLINYLLDKYDVRELKENSEKLIVIFGEFHSEQIQLEVVAAIKDISEKFKVDIAGFEGYSRNHKTDCASIVGAMNRIFTGKLGDISKINPKKFGVYGQMFSGHNFKAIGIEPRDLVIATSLSFEVLEFYNRLAANTLEDKTALFTSDGKSTPDAQRLLKACKYLKEKFPDYPTIDLEKLTVYEGESHRTVSATPKDAPYLNSLVEELTSWQLLNQLFPRNSHAVKVITEEMASRKGNVGIISIGTGHTIRGLPGKSIQEMFEELGFGFVVIDTKDRNSTSWKSMMMDLHKVFGIS